MNFLTLAFCLHVLIKTVRLNWKQLLAVTATKDRRSSFTFVILLQRRSCYNSILIILMLNLNSWKPLIALVADLGWTHITINTIFLFIVLWLNLAQTPSRDTTVRRTMLHTPLRFPTASCILLSSDTMLHAERAGLLTIDRWLQVLIKVQIWENS